MIIWLASYPKSGNTYLRSFLSSYYFSEDGKFDFKYLANIRQFPNIKFSKLKAQSYEDASKNWLFNQNAFFNRENFYFVKTHNCLFPYKSNPFTTINETLGAIYIVRDPRNVITSLTHHYSFNYEQAYSQMTNENACLAEASVDNDYSNFTYLNSWSNHYYSWKKNIIFKTLIIKYEDLERNKEDTFKKVINFINVLKGENKEINQIKLLNAIKSTNFSNLKNKEKNEGFEESVYSKKTGKKINFFNLGFNNRWQKILPKSVEEKLTSVFYKEILELGYL